MPPSLYRIACPSLVVWGDNDRMVPNAHGKRYAELLPGAMGLKTIKDSPNGDHSNGKP